MTDTWTCSRCPRSIGVPDLRRQQGWTLWAVDDDPDSNAFVAVCPDCLTPWERDEIARDLLEDGV